VSVVYIVRHAQASFGAENYDQLSELGRRQSERLGESLVQRGIVADRVISGTMQRHRDTAEIALKIAVDHNAFADDTVNIEIDAGFDEFDHLPLLATPAAQLHAQQVIAGGVAPGGRAVAFQKVFAEAVRGWVEEPDSADYPESFTAFTERVETGLIRVVSGLGKDGTALVFTSGGPMTWLLASLSGGGAAVFQRMHSVVVNTSITKIMVGRSGATMVTFNDHSHVDGPHRELLTYR